METSAENIPQSCGERVRDALRKIHPASTAKLVARDLSISQRTVENWLLLMSKPSLDHFGTMAEVYGLAFVVGVLPMVAALAPAVEMGGAAAFDAKTATLRRRQARARAGLRGRA